MRTVIICTFASSLIACGGLMRTPDQYRDDTAALLATHSDDVKKCYGIELEERREAHGTVTVSFTVARRTGKIVRINVDKERSTAPLGLQECVTKMLDGLELKPPDKQVGEATFVWEFEVEAKPAEKPAAEEPAEKPASDEPTG